MERPFICKCLTAEYEEEKSVLRGPVHIQFDIGKEQLFHVDIEQAVIRSIKISTDSDVSIFDLNTVLSKIERLLMLLDNQFLNVLVNSRVNIMHVKRNQRKPALNGKQSCLYAQKLSLLYRKILFELLQINDSLYLEKLKHCVLNLDNWNSISDDFLSWLSK